MQLFILKTDLQTADAVSTLFETNPGIASWSVDLEDIDKVLRIEADDSTIEAEIIEQLRTYGVFSEALPD